MTENGTPIMGYCEAKGRTCLSGLRVVWRYPDTPEGFLFCGHCWPHRKAILKVRHYRKEKEADK